MPKFHWNLGHLFFLNRPKLIQSKNWNLVENIYFSSLAFIPEYRQQNLVKNYVTWCEKSDEINYWRTHHQPRYFFLSIQNWQFIMSSWNQRWNELNSGWRSFNRSQSDIKYNFDHWFDSLSLGTGIKTSEWRFWKYYTIIIPI